MNDFVARIERTVRLIHASAARKQAMREELLAHLQAAFEQELAKQKDARAASQTAQQRLGNIEQLAAQLQASVPFIEQIMHWFLRKEILMSSWLWLVAWTVVMAVMMIIAPREMLPILAVVAIVGAAGRPAPFRGAGTPRPAGGAGPAPSSGPTACSGDGAAGEEVDG